MPGQVVSETSEGSLRFAFQYFVEAKCSAEEVHQLSRRETQFQPAPERPKAVKILAYPVI